MRVLLTEYFKNTNILRDNEILETIRRNQASNMFDKIFIMCEKDLPILNTNGPAHKAFSRFILSEKIALKTAQRVGKDYTKKKFTYIQGSMHYVLTGDRQTFKSMFEYANLHCADSIVIIANNDIYFDSTLKLLNEFNMTNQCLSLLRYDVQADGSPSKIFKYTSHDGARGYGNGGSRADSQDSWIFKTPILIPSKSDFYFGIPGCDNRISYLLHKEGYTVSNPALDIKSHHIHMTGIRTYTRHDTVKRPYLCIEPTTLGAVGKYNFIMK